MTVPPYGNVDKVQRDLGLPVRASEIGVDGNAERRSPGGKPREAEVVFRERREQSGE